jgi:phosphoribosylaminoimidazole-succinocarboxamide synthase
VLSHAARKDVDLEDAVRRDSTRSGQNHCNYMPDSGHLLPCGRFRTPAVSPSPLVATSLPNLPRFRTGKVRDVYDLGDSLLIVATDRISAFDYILATGIPDKGRVLTQLSAFWFQRLSHVIPNHFVTLDVDAYPPAAREHADDLRGRSMLVRKTAPIDIECVARGYLSGSGWKEYRETGRICGIGLPAGLRESDRLPRPIFTPATKAASGHDINIDEAETTRLLKDPALFARLRDTTLALYEQASAHAERCGILLADTKFEFGFDGETLLLIDEALTPDSSRFWPADEYSPGGPQPSFDKQFVRDYLEAINWNKQPPAPALPDDVVARTRAKYVEAFERLTGSRLDA